MVQRPPRSTRTDTLLPNTTRCRSTRAATDSVDGAKCPESIAALSHPIVSWSYEWSISLADARFLFDRATGLIRRGWLSLRTRGLRASWHRVRAQLRRVPADRKSTRLNSSH